MVIPSFGLLHGSQLERVGGIEPPSAAWKAAVIAIIRHPHKVFSFEVESTKQSYFRGDGFYSLRRA